MTLCNVHFFPFLFLQDRKQMCIFAFALRFVALASSNLLTMKLKFIIHYNTTWGQGLYVSITFNSEGGRPQRHLMPMVTEDGETWTLETAAVESRQRPVTSICYHYQVMDGDGRLLRREWDKVPRVYAFDSTRDYVFPDRWRDTPLQAHLYTEAFHVTTNHGRHQPVGVFRLPLFRRTVVFRVSAPQPSRHGQLESFPFPPHESRGRW